MAAVSLDFVLRSVNPGVFTTPPPLYDEAAESLVFGQIVGTYTWLVLPTATPGNSPTPTETPAPAFKSTPGPLPTATRSNSGVLTGQATASKPVRIDVFDTNNNAIGSIFVMSDGTFSMDVPPGTHTVVAFAPGFLTAQGLATFSVGNTTTKPIVTLVPGDIDNNNIIDQLDALMPQT